MSVKMNIERQPVIQEGNLTIDPQCCTVTLAGEKIDLYPKEFDVLCLLTQYPGWVLSPEQIYDAIWKESVSGCEHVKTVPGDFFYNKLIGEVNYGVGQLWGNVVYRIRRKNLNSGR